MGVLWVFPGSQPKFCAIAGAVTIGRGASCDVVLDAQQVSRTHLVVRRNGPVLVAEDANSRNGSFCDGQRFSKIGLNAGAVLRVGEVIGIVWRPPGDAEIAFSEVLPGLYGGPTLALRMAAIRRAAASDLSVIIQGETGAGKEGTAAAIHAFSGRSGPFVAVNCATLSERLAESQLVGHRRGAFTGAERDAKGYVGAAHQGTLFLDEVVDLSLDVQGKLLRALQQNEYVPLGETRPVSVDLRVVVSANRPLEGCVRAGTFRPDLFARLNGYTVRLPPLRERPEDIAFLFGHFLRQASGGQPPELKARLLEALQLYDWPLNVRELQTMARRLAVLHGHEAKLGHEHLPEEFLDAITEKAGAEGSSASSPGTREREPESESSARSSMITALIENGGNVVQAARQLGVSRAQFYRNVARAGIDVTQYRRAERGEEGAGDGHDSSSNGFG
jgi:DNA-binding NtrC family response regulator